MSVETLKNPQVISSEGEPHHEHASMVNAIFYCKFLNLTDQAAREYGVRKSLGKNKNHLSMEQASFESPCKTALEDLYNAGNHRQKLTDFEKNWGEEAEEFLGMFGRIKNKMEKDKEKVNTQVSGFNAIDILKNTITISRRLAHLSHDQRVTLLQSAGYTEKEAKEIGKKLAVSSGLTLVEIAVFMAGTYAAAGVAFADPIFDKVDNSTQTVVGLSYLAKYSTAILNAYQSVRLLREKSINNSPNIFSTGTYFLLDKFLPNRETVEQLKEKAINNSHNVFSKYANLLFYKLLQNKDNVRDFGAIMLSLAEPAAQDLLWTSTFAVPEIGASVVTARNASSTGLNLIEIGAKEVWLKIGRKKTA